MIKKSYVEMAYIAISLGLSQPIVLIHYFREEQYVGHRFNMIII